jgi:hypothetical protein
MAIDTAAALRKLQSGQTLTAAEKAALGLGPEVKTTAQKLEEYVSTSQARIEELDKLSAQLQSQTSTPLKPINQMSDAELRAYQAARLNQITVNRTGGPGAIEAPPYPAPAGLHWQKYGTSWNLYTENGTKVAQNVKPGSTPITYTPSSSNNNNGNGGGNNNGSNNSGSGSNTNATLVSTETDEYGNVVGVYSDGSTKILIPSGRKYKSTVDMDAYALLEQTFKDFGLEDLTDTIKGYMERGIGSEQAALEIRKSQPYINRFRGNEIRRQVGLNVLSEAEYLTLENSYNETLRAYGLQGYFGTDRKTAQSRMADIIGNDISSTEFKDRIDTVVTRVQNADPAIKRTLTMFYNINDTDLIKYFLDPKANLPKLQEKVTAAEIGSAALGQGLATNVSDATALALFGITRGQALEGYAKIGESLPTTKKLGSIYAEEGIDYTQQTAEEEVFKGLASAERKRRQLASREVATFGGASGVSKSAFGSATGGAF